ncbi:hypothetical protein [Fluviispira vulneris]|uniref:hypothetical protein n=1 Tax=Fluviispira vulneris TaxID=2763012 RepID=UPI001648FA2E|nr:hypothetical protein [Fluviispira vulneris]
MNKFKASCDSGQALVSGLIFLILAMLSTLFFLFISESFYRAFSNINKERENKLRDLSLIAHKLNHISLNNLQIITALSVAQNAFAESAETGLYISFSQPYWQTYQSLQKASVHSDGDFKKNALTQKNKEYINNIYKSFRLKSGRGLFIAKSLAEKNKVIINSLPKNIQKYFVQSSNKDVFCLSLASQGKKYISPGFINLPLIENLYNFYLLRDDCQLSHKNGAYAVVNKILPFLSGTESNLVLDYEKLAEHLNQTVNFGLSLVSFTQAKSFLYDLYLQDSPKLKANVKFTKVTKYFTKIKFFKSLNLENEDFFNSSPKDILVRITHPFFICSAKSKWQGDFLEEKDWQHLTACSLSEGNFYKSFFTPNWIALVTQEKGKNEYF